MKCIIGTKTGMTQIFKEDGVVIPVTRVQAGPCTVTQVKTAKKDGVNSIQVGYGTQKKFRINKSIQGHLKDLPLVRHMHEFRTDEDHQGLQKGNTFTVKIFEVGDKVDVTGISKGKGFQGVVKRYNFKGQAASHGNKDQLRMPGSIGATGPARVFKGTKMGGHMGSDQVTVKNLEIAGIDADTHEILIKGAVPGAKGSILYIHTLAGTFEPEVEEAPKTEEVTAVEEAPEAVIEEVAPTEEKVVDTTEGEAEKAPVSEDNEKQA